jgi:hypothetical protein
MRKNLFRFMLLSAFVAPALPIALAQAKEDKAGTASVSGRVTRGGKPLVGIQVFAHRSNQYSGWEPGGATTKTDAEGWYQFTNLAAGQYLIRPRAMADVFLENGALINGKTVLVQDGEVVKNLDISLVKGGVITGTITDENDKTLVEAVVRLVRKQERGSSSNFISSLLPLMNKTDDRGVYRLFGLPSGKYWLLARPQVAAALVRENRAQFRSEAETANNAIELVPCQQLKNYGLKFSNGVK